MAPKTSGLIPVKIGERIAFKNAVTPVLSCAIATPAASPFAAMLFSNKSWLKSGDIYRYNIMYVVLELVLALLVGLPLANALIH